MSAQSITLGQGFREVAFRGKRIGTGEWTYGYLVQLGADCYIFTGRLEVYHTDPYADFERHEVVLETVGEYTGLVDKNGVRIFEGDDEKERIYCS
jgi:uncharacterized phage protein (TIGR01671 family)